MPPGKRRMEGFSSRSFSITSGRQPLAECLGISEKRVYRLVESGALSGKKIGKNWLIRYADIVNYEKED